MLNVNVKCKCKCSVYMSDLTTEHYNISIIHSFPSRDYNGYLAGNRTAEQRSEMSTNSGHLCAVQPVGRKNVWPENVY